MALAPQRSASPTPGPDPSLVPKARFQTPVGLARPVGWRSRFAGPAPCTRPRHGKPGVCGCRRHQLGHDRFMAVIPRAGPGCRCCPVLERGPAVSACLVLYGSRPGLGARLGYHRCSGHRPSGCPHWLERFFATCQAPELASTVDRPGKPACTANHPQVSPNTDVAITTTAIAGFWWSHMGWMFQTIPATAAVPAHRRSAARPLLPPG